MSSCKKSLQGLASSQKAVTRFSQEVQKHDVQENDDQTVVNRISGLLRRSIARMIKKTFEFRAPKSFGIVSLHQTKRILETNTNAVRKIRILVYTL